ncbi:MAG: HAD family hydrolase [Butyrivibrio sp.]|nr:HAD family hydrolase [Butyrivibrio sp.]
MKSINTIIFDMDGTVLNTLTDLTVSMNHVMNRFGFPTHTEDEYRKAFGNGIRNALCETVPEGTPSETIDEMLPIFKEHYNAHCLDKTGPYDGILLVMKELIKRGYKMAIVSNKIDSAVKELNKKFFSDAIDVAIGEKDGINRKPAPDMVLEALKELHSTQEEAVYIGDSEVDFETAKNSELPCISVLWGFRDEDFLRTLGADIFVKEPMQLLDAIEKLF